MRSLLDKVVVITGAAGGIGTALARQFGRAGAKLALIDIDGEALARLASELEGAGIQASTHVADVGQLAELEGAREGILAAHGGVDVLVNNAGLTVLADFEELEQAELERVIAVNLWGVIHGCRVFLPALRERPRGHIVNMSSEAGLVGFPWQTIYCATKFAVRGLSQSLRAELAGQKVDVTCVLPGATRTGIIRVAPTRNAEIGAWLGDKLATRGYPTSVLARKIVRAVRLNRAELRVGPDTWSLWLALRLAPRLVAGFFSLAVRIARHRARTRAAGGPS